MSLGQLFAKPSRVVLLHYHIFKNAGSTIDFALKQNFGDRLAYLHGDRFDSMVSNSALLDFLTKNPDVAAVSSHHLRPPKPAAEQFLLEDILIFRHPLDRLRSMYDFYREALVTDDPLTIEAKRRDLRSFSELLVAEYPHLASNSQVNYTANQGGKIPDEADCARSCAIAQQAAVVGVTDQFEKCMVTAEHRLRGHFPGLQLSSAPRNVSRGRRKNLQQRLRAFEKACGSRLYNLLLESNKLDLKLVDTARNEVETRFQQVPSAEAWLGHFKERVKKSDIMTVAFDHPHDFVRFIN